MTACSPPSIAIIGAGPAGLVAAEVLAEAGFVVTLYDQMPSPGRKFLMAGRGGLNLTHSEDFGLFLSRYRPYSDLLLDAIKAYPPEALMAWSKELGQETFIGSSGRVFPNSFKATPLLRSWLTRLQGKGVQFSFRHRWIGWDATNQLAFETPEGVKQISADATLLALGGASWPRLGSDAFWVNILAEHDIMIAPLKPANMGFLAPWSDYFQKRFEGEPLKKIKISYGSHASSGDAIITRQGIEGGVLYAIGRAIRDNILQEGQAVVTLDLKPDSPIGVLANRLGAPRKGQSTSNFLRKAVNLSPVSIGLLREMCGANVPVSPRELATLIKSLPLRLTGTARVDRAISTAGGICFSEIDNSFMLRKRPGTFVAGEMLDWEAPTGGYLLQACFATGRAAAEGLAKYCQMKYCKVKLDQRISQ